jgi:hypothetical protein
VTQTLKQITVRVQCRASRPSGSGETLCGTILGDIRGPVRFVQLAARAPEEPDGRTWLKCPRRDCRTWNVFEDLEAK